MPADDALQVGIGLGGATSRVQCLNNLKQIGLALHTGGGNGPGAPYGYVNQFSSQHAEGADFLFAVGCGEQTPTGANVPLDQVTEPVIRVAKEQLTGVQCEQAWKTPTGNYEVRGRTPNGKVRDIQVRPDGSVVEID